MILTDMITGLRNAGKTTVINRLLHEIYRDKQVSVIQNELGKTEIDSSALPQGDASLQKMTGGCICCTLQTGLLEGIRQQVRDFNPEIIILEAAGQARPSDLLTLPSYYPGLQIHISLHVIDGYHFPALFEMMGPAYTEPVRQSRFLYVNRLAERPDKARETLQRLRAIQPDAVIFHDAPELLTEKYLTENLPDCDRIFPFSAGELLRLSCLTQQKTTVPNNIMKQRKKPVMIQPWGRT